MEITEMTDTDTSKGSKRQNKMWQDEGEDSLQSATISRSKEKKRHKK